MKTISCQSIVALLLFILASPAFSFHYEPYPQVTAEYFHSNAVFTGKVLSERAEMSEALSDGDRFTNGWWYSIQVSKVFLGQKKDVIEVYTENSSGRLRLEVGQEYLVFAITYNNGLEICYGGNTELLSKSKQKIEQLEQIPKMTDGEIEGRTVAQTHWKGIEGIKVTISGNGKALSCTTDKDGWFHIRVEPGKYKATVEDLTIIPYDMSYDKPEDFEVKKGGCAEIQFVRWRRNE